MMIGELSRRSGLAASCIRYYERIGLIPRARRVSGWRVFDDDALPRLMVISGAAKAGFSLAEISDLFRRSRSWRATVRRKIGELDVAAARIELMKAMLEATLRCGCVDTNLCTEFYVWSRGRKPTSRAAARNASTSPQRHRPVNRSRSAH